MSCVPVRPSQCVGVEYSSGSRFPNSLRGLFWILCSTSKSTPLRHCSLMHLVILGSHGMRALDAARCMGIAILDRTSHMASDVDESIFWR